MPHRLLAFLVGGLLLLCAAPALAAPANVTLRVEGLTQTLVPRTPILTDNRVVNKDGVAGHDCTGTSAAGALEIGTAGDWGGSFFAGLGYSVERVFGETHAFPQPDFFSLWINNRSSPVGVCGAELQAGDDVLIFVDRCESDPITFACTNPPVLPLRLIAPSTVAPGTPFDVSVVEIAPDATESQEAGATIEGGDAPATTNAAGVATVTLGAGGLHALRATKPNRARSALQSICATSGSDGLCGTTTPGAPGSAAVACDTSGADGLCGTRDSSAPSASIAGIADKHRFARGKGPRTLRVNVKPDPSGLLTVKLRLTRTDGPRCTYFSGRSERFRTPRGAKCGAEHGFWFSVGDREQTSYLLPRALPRGRYVLDVNAIDKAFNRDDARRRGSNRIVFFVG
jgi:hypothetical protein